MNSSIKLIFVPAPAVGHLVSAVEMAKLLVARDCRISATVLLLKLPLKSDQNPTAESLSSSVAGTERIDFVDLPTDEPPVETSPLVFLSTFYKNQKRHVRNAVGKILSGGGSGQVGGFMLDLFCTSMIDVADEFGVPSYVFLTSGAGFLCLMNHIFSDKESFDYTKVKEESVVPGFVNPLPEKILPFSLQNKVSVSRFQDARRGVARSKGVLINTFEELEPGMIESLSSLDRTYQFPPVYHVGPVIHLGQGHGFGTERTAEIMEWLNGQPASSVLFLCFGSMGSFEGDQVRDIAIALERTRVPFLWSLRRRGTTGDKIFPTTTEYENRADILPEGFIKRTAGIGKVVGWAPQVAVLGHPSIGGFVSHCGWNSTLESVWFGIPVATWPLFAEQHLNAFQIVKEFELAVEISFDYRMDIYAEKIVDSGELVVKAEQIERGIVKLMESESDLRKRVKEMSEKSRKALLPGGSSYTSLSSFIDDIIMKSLA